MRTGKLTPRSNNCVDAMRFSGGFGQPDGFASVLDVKINEGGEVCLTLTHRENGNESTWSVMLTDSQRNAMAAMLGEYKPRTFERYDPRSTCS